MLKARAVRQKGFSLIELVIVLVITLTVLATIGFRTSGAISNMEVEVVASEVALAIYEAKDQAMRGNLDAAKRTFNLEKALVRPHNGVLVRTSPLTNNSNCKTPCSSDLDSKGSEINSICVSENSFCFTPASVFSFDRFSGRLTNSHVIFINSDKRNLAILLTKEGNHYIAEYINGAWQTQRDLQKLFPTQNNTSKNDYTGETK